MSKPYDLTGETFNYLTALELVGSKHGKALWKCSCKCGNEVLVISSHLLRGTTKSCGCWIKRNQIVKNCVECNKEIRLKASHAEKEGTYCSRECMTVGYKKVMKGADNPNWRHGLAYTTEYRRPYHEKFKIQNPELIRIYNRKMKAKRASATGSHSYSDIVEKYNQQWFSCYWCFETLDETYEVDHVVPLARGGSNGSNNIVLSCYKCNRQKSDKFVSEWIVEQNSRCKRKLNDCNTGEYSRLIRSVSYESSFLLGGVEFKNLPTT